MPLSTVVKNFRNGTVTVKDGTGTPLDVTITLEQGNFSISGLNQGNKEVTTYLDRGDLASVRHTNRTFPTFSLGALMSEFSDATNENILDLILKTGSFAAAVSTLGATAEVYTLDVVLTVEGTDLGDGADHVCTLEDCRVSIDFAEGDPNTFTIQGTVYGTVTFT